MQRRTAFLFAVAFLSAASVAAAQATPPAPATAADSIYAHARQLVVSGNGAAGRVLVDSMITATTPDTPAYAEALYWRATLAATSTDAERDYRRVVVEYPLSPRAGDALLQLAQLEIARGDRVPAITHLQRFLLENPKSTERTRAGLLLVRLAFEQNEAQVGCTFLGRILREVPESSVELRNQLTYYSPRCSNVDTTKFTQVAGAGGSSASDSAAKTDTTHRDSTTAGGKAKFTLQIAAYKTRAEADALMKRLKARGLDVRIAGTAKTFRVRVGHYATRTAAAAAARELKTSKKIDAFVTEIGTDDK